ncbi:nucleotide pyrophosphohydrolase [Shewanella baltica]|uniref:nucleotide pyrophosphohydrolase n=1 Tax=Shewanella baltica TaxID=62322 RepID=UPI00217D5161|nr:nucleotide pyrophosphohydrolase [Shewanella baltica]MCS6180399.1 nucleotide pyrophosphohydrolase [Shewanella baltica]MCS6233605.1 nucleotide pyrophosphohydrolase [Shewanella baltica]MCS6256623.1 nucleotide pyrophosphohydrolase [Shewanella baltica]MCS6268189.1 nucleotide pyrophosphohydrolase [Shewanella baltica]
MSTTIEELKERLKTFADERDWSQFHSPKNLAMALTVEVSELVEIFQWMKDGDSRELKLRDHQKASEEIADIFLYLLMISDKLDVNLLDVAADKIELNATKYPIEKCYGKSAKYDQL